MTVVDLDKHLEEICLQDCESIIQYPGALGEFFGSDLHEAACLVIIGEPKCGKTRFLHDMAVRSIESGNSVAYFNVGRYQKEYTLLQITKRIVERPFKHAKVKIPVGFVFDDEHSSESFVVKEEIEFCDDWRQAGQKKIEDFRSRYLNLGIKFQIVDIPESSSVLDEVVLFLTKCGPDVPGVVLIDSHFEIDNLDTMKLRCIANEFTCLLVITSNIFIEGKSPTLLSSVHVKNKHKITHVTGMIAINRTIEERNNGVMRLNWIVRREDAFDERKPVYVAGCPEIACPCMYSAFYHKEKEGDD